MINVVDETIQGGDALHQAALEEGPLVRRDDARDQVKRDQPFRARAILVLLAIDSKGDAHAAKNHLGFLAPARHHVAGLACQPFVIDLVLVANLLALSKELVGQLGIHLVELLHALSPAL